MSGRYQRDFRSAVVRPAECSETLRGSVHERPVRGTLRTALLAEPLPSVPALLSSRSEELLESIVLQFEGPAVKAERPSVLLPTHSQFTDGVQQRWRACWTCKMA